MIWVAGVALPWRDRNRRRGIALFMFHPKHEQSGDESGFHDSNDETGGLKFCILPVSAHHMSLRVHDTCVSR